MLPMTGHQWRSPRLAQTTHQLQAELDHGWAGLLAELRVAPGSSDETALAWLVMDDPAAHDWRVVDAALDRLTCPRVRRRPYPGGYQLRAV